MKKSLEGCFEGDLPGYKPNLLAAVSALLGEEKPAGKLPVDILAVNDKYEYDTGNVKYAFGYSCEK